jgi:hypothetical protein
MPLGLALLARVRVRNRAGSWSLLGRWLWGFREERYGPGKSGNGCG